MIQDLDSNKYFSYGGKNKDAKIRLFCFPYAGAGASVYARWQSYFKSDLIEVMPIQLPGREKRYYEEYEKNVIKITKDIVRNIQEYMDKPYAIFGHSMGGVFGYEFARELSKNYNKHPLSLFVSASSAPHTMPDSVLRKDSLTEDEFVSLLNRFNGIDPELLKIKEYYEYFVPTLRNDFITIGTYNPEEKYVLDCPIHTFYGYEDSNIPEENIVLWNEYTNTKVSDKAFDGGHFFIKDYYQDICDYIENTLSFY